MPAHITGLADLPHGVGGGQGALAASLAGSGERGADTSGASGPGAGWPGESGGPEGARLTAPMNTTSSIGWTTTM